MYIDAILDKKTDTIHIAERRAGQRVLRDLPVSHVFYYEDANGSHRSIFGHACKRSAWTNGQKFHQALRERRQSGRRIFESDINPVFRALAEHYMDAEAPILHLGFFDIEVGFDLQRGYAPPSDPFNPITAISLYRSADKTLLSFVLRPDNVAPADAEAVVATTPDCLLFDTEAALLQAFLDAIEDVDCLIGWNSNAYDLPYVVNRIRRIIDIQTTKRLCLWEQAPSPRQYKNKFGRPVDAYDLVGRVHLDYLELYAKHTPQQRLSYALNAIGEIEVGETKVPYAGTLDELYHNDFDNFIQYNRQDVMLMVKIDDRLKFVALANQIAHSNCVLLKTTMGSVALVEQAIINEMHAMGFIAPDRPARDADDDDVVDDDSDDDSDSDEDEDAVAEPGHVPVVGAYVAQPKVGLQDYVGCVDIKSLYPSVIRALNMSPETLVGQVRLDETMAVVQQRIIKLAKTQRPEAWEGIFCTFEVQHMLDQDDTLVTVDFFDHLGDPAVTTRRLTGRQLHAYIFNPANQVCISANGTIFSTATDGIIPVLLAKWYAEREAMQEKQKMYEDMAAGIEIADDLRGIRHGCETHNLRIEGSRIVPRDDQAKKAILAQAGFWNQRQQARKIILNSAYGALLNAACRFYDQRLGQSTTLSGRSIVRHMNAKINEIITGVYDYKGDAIQYSDTDSGYFTISTTWKDNPSYAEFDWSLDNIISLYDLIAEEANQTFVEFMQRNFHTDLAHGSIISAGRELVASRGLFIKKKKYAVLMVDKEGSRLDVDGKPGKLKVMGLDLKRADTPKVMQQFLAKLLLDLLTGVSQAQMFADIKAFRQSFKARPGWEKGSPKKVANLAEFAAKLATSDRKGLAVERTLRRHEKLRVTMPGHVRASLNWNRLCEVHNDRHATRITDSSRIIVCKLRNNALGMTSVAYPIDEPHLPAWFCDLPFDHEAMEATIIDAKILNLCGVLNWDLTATRSVAAEDLFSWS